jgi:hypothetical protein
MTMLTSAFERPSHAPGRRDTVEAGAANVRRAIIKRFCLDALCIVAAGAILAAIIGLEAAFYVRGLID